MLGRTLVSLVSGPRGNSAHCTPGSCFPVYGVLIHGNIAKLASSGVTSCSSLAQFRPPRARAVLRARTFPSVWTMYWASGRRASHVGAADAFIGRKLLIGDAAEHAR